MSSLFTALNLRVPNLWVHANEPFAWMDSFIELANQPVFFLDPGAGLLGYDKIQRQWLTVVEERKGEDEQGNTIVKVLPVSELNNAIDYVAEQTGSLIFFAGDELIKEFMGYSAGVHFMWRNKFYNNEEPLKMPQFIFLATTPEIPPHISSFAMYINGNNAFTHDNMVSMINDLDAAAGSQRSIFDNPAEASIVTEAASGLSELTTIDTLFGSIFSSPRRVLDTKTVVDRKAELLKASTSLEYRQPQYGLGDVAGLDQAKQMITNAKWIIENEAEAAEYGISPTRRFLLLGLPGTGKSMICEAAAHELGYGLVQVGVSRVLNSFIGNSEANMRNMFDQLERLAPIVAWADEIGRDLSGGGSSNYTDGGTTARVHGEFLTRMQDLHPQVFFFAAANGLDHLSPEMLRAGRWDKMMYVGFPAFNERKEIFRIHLNRLPGDWDYDTLAERSVCWTGAEIVSLINDTKNRIVPTERRPITQDDIIATMAKTKNLIWIKAKPNVIDSYRAAIEHYEWASTAQRNDAEAIASGYEPNVKKATKTVIG
jgi:AAA+ superfamily predicted ATPase